MNERKAKKNNFPLSDVCWFSEGHYVSVLHFNIIKEMLLNKELLLTVYYW